MQLHLMHNILSSASADKELVARLEASGCTTLMFEEGNAFYEKAVTSRAKEINAEDALRATERRRSDLQIAIRDVYAGFVGVAKLCFGRVAL